MLKYKLLEVQDLIRYCEDIEKCYSDNKLILDEQNYIDISSREKLLDLLAGFINAKDSFVVGILSSDESILFGIVVFDNIRMANTSCAEVHIAISKEIWGKLCRTVFNEMLIACNIDVLYCQIPKIAVRAIGMCKKLGFKKTGYIPMALPYTNSKGECKMYDINIYTHQRGV